MFQLDDYYQNLNLLKEKHKKLITNNFLNRKDLGIYSKQESSTLFFGFDSLVLLCEDNGVRRMYFNSCCFDKLLLAIEEFREHENCDIVFEYISKETISPDIIRRFDLENIKSYAILNKWQSIEINLKNQSDDDMLVFNIARSKDLDEIQELFLNSFDKFISHLPNNEFLKKLITRELVFCCWCGEKIVGVICFDSIGTNGLYLYQVAIEPSVKGKGIGWKLAQFAYRKFKYYKIFTSWVDERNIISEKLHIKLGFKKMPLKTMVFLIKSKS